jgi:hypothetical protein
MRFVIPVCRISVLASMCTGQPLATESVDLFSMMASTLPSSIGHPSLEEVYKKSSIARAALYFLLLIFTFSHQCIMGINRIHLSRHIPPYF